MKLPREFCRGPQWVNAAARRTWEPVLQAAQAAWTELEVVSITEGVRDSALIYVTPEELATASRDCAGMGLEVQVLAVAGAQLRIAVHRPGLAIAWHRAWAESDDRAIGELLGFPGCCLDFFQREWMAGRETLTAMPSPEGPWEANPFLRPMGVRLTPHLPCAADCEATVAHARAFREAGARAGVDVVAIEALLRLPVDYDAAAGLAIVSTPHFRFMTAADPGRRRLARAAQDGVGPLPLEETPTAWHDNGFSSQAAMTAAHAVVLRQIGRVNSALDLGCGDGALLEKLARERVWRVDPGLWVGVEADEGRASRGAARRGPRVQVLHGKIQDPDLAAASGFDVVVLMPGRLLEMTAEDATMVRAALPRAGARLVVYSYNGALAEQCRAAGIAITSTVIQSGETQAAEGKVE